ncbi:lasso peptide biosynthesis PqqD family chaperone [Streptomyces griseocarneus]|uniref:lasso peptide biosynthesis PqqD family chaperone n=1 Tax=Streptomyces griseocarneus TaxID=51201 RepID=UPI00167F0520|nr:lasso peptide biosynthesis PqqD family chaperone [Streptomyces griseocarneus]
MRDSSRIATIAQLMTGRGSRLHMMGGGGDELFSALPPHLHDHVRSHPLAAFTRIRTHRASQHWPLWPLLRQLADRRTFGQWLAAWADSLTEPEPPPTAPGRRAPSTAWGVDLRMPSWATPDAVRAVQSLLREVAEAAEALAPRRGQHAALTCVQAGGRGVRQLDHVFSRKGLAYAAPYLDDSVLEAALAIRVPERSTPGRYKPVLAAAMDGIVPDSVLQQRTKGEYSVDFHISLRHNRAALVELFDDSQLARAGLIDTAAIRTNLLGVHPTPDALRSLGPSLGSENLAPLSCRGHPPTEHRDHRRSVVSLALRHDVCAMDTEDGMVLLDKVTGRYWQLNGTATLILRTLLGGAAPPDTACRLREVYPQLTAERSLSDTAAVIGALFEARLVVPA